MRLPDIYTRAELADPAPLPPKRRPADPRQLALEPRKLQRRAPASERRDESALIHRVRIRLAKERDLVLWRHSAPPTNRDAAGNFFEAGLPRGCPDLVGILLPQGRFFSLETKVSHRDDCSCAPCTRQRDFRALIRKFGGFAALVRTEDQALAALDRARRGETS